MKIFLDALANFSVGTIAYIISNMEIITRKYPNCTFYLFSTNPEVHKLYFSKLPFSIKIIRRSRSYLSTIVQIRQILRKVDIIISSWGDAYVTLPTYMLFPKAFSIYNRSTPMILFPSSIGPFSHGLKDYIAYMGLKMFDIVIVRDIETYNYLKRYPLKHLKLIHDTAFVLPPVSDNWIDKTLVRIGLNKKKFIGINVSVLLLHEFKRINESYIQLIKKLIEWIKSDLKVAVLLVPHQIFPDQYDFSRRRYKSRRGDDRYVIQMVLKGLENTDNIFHLSEYYTPSQLKGIISRSEIFIGGRMHSIIASLSSNVPSLIMQYSHKAIGMMKMLNMSEFSWEISDDIQNLKNKTKLLWEKKEIIKDRLKNIMPSIKSEIFSLADEIEYCLIKK